MGNVKITKRAQWGHNDDAGPAQGTKPGKKASAPGTTQTGGKTDQYTGQTGATGATATQHTNPVNGLSHRGPVVRVPPPDFSAETQAVLAEQYFAAHPGLDRNQASLKRARFVRVEGESWSDLAALMLNNNDLPPWVARVLGSVIARFSGSDPNYSPTGIVALPDLKDIDQLLRADSSRMNRWAWRAMARQTLGGLASREQVMAYAEQLARANGRSVEDAPPENPNRPAPEQAAAAPAASGLAAGASAVAEPDTAALEMLGVSLRDLNDTPRQGGGYTVRDGDTLHQMILRAYGEDLRRQGEDLRARLIAQGATPAQAADQVGAYLNEKVENLKLALISLHRLGGGGRIEPEPDDTMFFPRLDRMEGLIANAESAGILAAKRSADNPIFTLVHAGTQNVMQDLQTLQPPEHAASPSTEQKAEALHEAQSIVTNQRVGRALTCGTPTLTPFMCVPFSLDGFAIEFGEDWQSRSGRMARATGQSLADYVKQEHPDLTPAEVTARSAPADAMARNVLAALQQASSEDGRLTIEVRSGETLGAAFVRMVQGAYPMDEAWLGSARRMVDGQGQQTIDLGVILYLAGEELGGLKALESTHDAWAGKLVEKTHGNFNDSAVEYPRARRQTYSDPQIEESLKQALRGRGVDPDKLASDLRAALMADLRKRVETIARTAQNANDFTQAVTDAARAIAAAANVAADKDQASRAPVRPPPRSRR